MFSLYEHVMAVTPRVILGGGLTVSDKLVSQFSVSLLVLFGVVSLVDHYAANPELVQCACPSGAGSTGPCDRNFLNSACWVQDEFYFPETSDVTGNATLGSRVDTDAARFQWVGLLFLGLAIVGCIPRGFWVMLTSLAGFNEKKFVKEARQLQAEGGDVEAADRDLHHYFTARFPSLLRGPPSRDGSLKGPFGKAMQRVDRLTVRFFVTKALYLLILIIQISVLAEHGGATALGTAVPTLAWCRLRHLGDTVAMCAFPSNQLSHVLVRLLFAWLLVLLIVYLCSLLLWILRFFPKGARYRYMRRLLSVIDNVETHIDAKLCVKFVEKFLRVDGVLTVRLVHYVTDAATAATLARLQWDKFRAAAELEPLEEEKPLPVPASTLP